MSKLTLRMGEGMTPLVTAPRLGERLGATRLFVKDEHWTPLSCHRFRANEVRLQLSLLAYNLGNLWRRLVLPNRIDNWWLTRGRMVYTSDCSATHNGNPG